MGIPSDELYCILEGKGVVWTTLGVAMVSFLKTRCKKVAHKSAEFRLQSKDYRQVVFFFFFYFIFTYAMYCQKCGRADSLPRMEERHTGCLPCSADVMVARTYHIIHGNEGHDLPKHNHVQGFSGETITLVPHGVIIVSLKQLEALMVAAAPLRQKRLQFLI